MYIGYLSLGGVELINAQRTEAYIRNNASWIPLTNCQDCVALPDALEEGPYESPSVDNAEWFDPNAPESSRFYGLYPLEVQGIEDSTRTAAVTESVTDGGSVGQVRYGTRSIRVRGLLIAADERAMAYGTSWLRSALDPKMCEDHGGGSCGGAQLCYYSSCPEVCELYDSTFQAGSTIPLKESESTSPLILRQPFNDETIWRATFEISKYADGTIISYGANSTEDESNVEHHGPVVLSRHNYVLNPRFMNGLTNWTKDAPGDLNVLLLGADNHWGYRSGGLPGPEAVTAWEGTPEESTSVIRLVADSSVMYRNLMPNPNFATIDPDVEVRRNLHISPIPDITVWSFIPSGGATASATFPTTGTPNSLVTKWARYQVTGANASTGNVRMGNLGSSSSPVVAGTTYTISAFCRASKIDYTSVSLEVDWYNGSTFLSTTIIDSDLLSAVDTWERRSGTVVAPATSTRATLRMKFTGAAVIGDVFGVAAPLIEATTQLRNYFDGGVDNGYLITAWAAATNASASTMTLTPTTEVTSGPEALAAQAFESVVVYPDTDSNDTYATFGAENTMQLGMAAGESYTALVTLDVPFTPSGSSYNTNAFTIAVVSNPGGVSQVIANSLAAAPNDTANLRLNFTLPADATEASIRIYNGSSVITEVIEFWSFALVETGPSGTTPYEGDFFDGGTSVVSRVRTSAINVNTGSGIQTVSFDAYAFSSTIPFVRVEVWNTDTATMVTFAEFDITTDTRRYSFQSPSGGHLEIRFVTGGEFVWSNVLVEAGHTQLPYFDGSSLEDVGMLGYMTQEIEPEYEIKWLGTAHNSVSQAVWLGTPVIGAPMATAAEDPKTGLCHAYPYFNIQQGSVEGVIQLAVRLPVPIELQVQPYERTLHEVTATEGPSIISERILSNGAVMREVDFVMVAGTPFPYGATITLMHPTKISSLSTIPWIDPPCEDPVPVPIVDPDCPPVASPPRPPSIANACVTPENQWQRYWLPIPAEVVSTWSATIPTVTITSGTKTIRQVRVRVYPNPYNRSLSGIKSRINSIPNPTDYWDRPGWTVLNGTRARNATGGPSNRPYIRATATAAHATGTFGLGYSTPGPTYRVRVTPGSWVIPSLWTRTGAARGVRLRYTFQSTAAGWVDVIGYGSNVTTGVNTWQELTMSAVQVPTNAEWVNIDVITTSVATIGEFIDATMGMVEVFRTSGLAVHGTYFDGELAADNGWYYYWQGLDVEGDGIGPSAALFGQAVDPCSWCGEFIISYLPPRTQLTVDGILESAVASISGQPAASANHLLYAGDGSPMVWPELTCGNDYLLAIDVPQPLLSDVTVSINVTNRE